MTWATRRSATTASRRWPQLAAGCGGFEGNAQSLRLLTRLEAKAPGAGLNLTRATLDATLKYPWLGPGGARTSARQVRRLRRRRGGLRAGSGTGAPAGRPCLEAQVMDWADDVAYSVHDLEDGLHAGLIQLGQLRDPAERAAVAELTLVSYCAPGSATRGRAGRGVRRAAGPGLLARAVRRRPGLGGRGQVADQRADRPVLRAAEQATRPAGPPPLTRYAADLAVPRQQRLECALLKGVTAQYVMSRPGAAARRPASARSSPSWPRPCGPGRPARWTRCFAAAFAAAGDRPGPAPGGHRPDRLARPTPRPTGLARAPMRGPPLQHRLAT